MQADLPRRNVSVRQVGNASDTFDAFVANKKFQFFANAVTSFHVGNFCDDNHVAVFLCFKVGSGSERNCGAASHIGQPNSHPTADDASGRKVRSGQVFQQIVQSAVGLVDDLNYGVAHF